MRIVSLIVALAALGVAGYAFHNGQARLERLDILEKKASVLEASIGGIVEKLNDQADEEPVPVESGSSEEVQSRLAQVEGKLARLEALEPTGRSSKEMLAEGAREMIRKIVREEQAALIQEQEEERAVKKEQLHAKMEKQFEEMRERQKKRLEEWIRKFCEKAGLTITEEQGILEAYKWAQEERNRMLQDRREEGPPMLFGPEQFAKIAEQRDEKIKELLSAAKFDSDVEVDILDQVDLAVQAAGVGGFEFLQLKGGQATGSELLLRGRGRGGRFLRGLLEQLVDL